MKKINKIGVTVKTLLQEGYSQIWISRKLKISKQRVNYWSKADIKTTVVRKNKLPDKYIKKIISLAQDKTTSEMSSNRIKDIYLKLLVFKF